jgi:hypothetical protein
MLVVETIAKIRRAYFAQNKPIKTDLPRVSGVAKGRAQGDPVAGGGAGQAMAAALGT